MKKSQRYAIGIGQVNQRNLRMDRAPNRGSTDHSHKHSLAIVFFGVLLLGGLGSTPSIASDREFKDCQSCPVMVAIPAGEFYMGFDGGEPLRYEGPVRKINIKQSFAIGKFEVTNAQYRQFIKETGHRSGRNCNLLLNGSYGPVANTDWSDPGYERPIQDDEPVVCVDWNDAQAYLTWLSRISGQRYRLPSEAEWEYVARDNRPGHRLIWGENATQACRESNIFDQAGFRDRSDHNIEVAPCDDGSPEVARVGSRAANQFGVHDMIGNVWEWVEDCYVMPVPDTAPRDGSAQLTLGCDRRVARGGSWLSAYSRQSPTFRGRDPPGLVSQIFGFRIARDLDPHVPAVATVDMRNDFSR